MGWTEIALLLAKWGPAGIDLAQKLWEKWSSGKAPTTADFDELRAIAAKTAKSQMLEALTRAGIDPDSEQGRAMLALV